MTEPLTAGQQGQHGQQRQQEQVIPLDLLDRQE